MTWQTRTLALFIASTAMVSGPTNPLVEAAMEIGEQPTGTADEPATTARPATTAEPRAGTFEAFMGSFGSPQRWSGR